MNNMTTTPHEMYVRLSLPDGVERCPVCCSKGEMYQYQEVPGGSATKVVMCSHGEELVPEGALVEEGCPLYMPPYSFYKATQREAVAHWNAYAQALVALRIGNMQEMLS